MAKYTTEWADCTEFGSIITERTFKRFELSLEDRELLLENALKLEYMGYSVGIPPELLEKGGESCPNEPESAEKPGKRASG